ncbi:hypothetical protein G7077_05250 [Sphingomonas piscis]|uniref:Uncharacterized protein n=1 Tax=Sphingomonas piscis TaxID=2714943 RepID=A0A6G7YNS9_9SPHN|nr:hypothetical protein [Sphingomonas piscis]QIK78400.1 hypothetical protein G7077_05250 [Sphingomonas piscis]
MLKITTPLALAAIVLADAAAIQAPATAQTNSRGEIIVYGDDPCPRPEGEVIVCRRRPATERYRIPEAYRPTGDRQQTQGWVGQQQALRTVGATGTGSCSEVGPGGHTGCLLRDIQNNDAAREEADEADTAPTRR